MTSLEMSQGASLMCCQINDHLDLVVSVCISCRRIEAALSSKSSQTSSSSTPSKSSQTSSSSFPATDQSAVPEDGEGFRWNTTGDHASTGSSSKAGHIYLGK